MNLDTIIKPYSSGIKFSANDVHKKSFMKKIVLPITACFFATVLWSCNNSNNTGSTTGDSSTTTTSTNTGTGNTPETSDSNKSANGATANTPTTSTAATKMTLSKEDSTFVMKAAAGGMMEVELGNVAQQNGNNARVKNFGQMMVSDHSKANDELKSLASSKGIALPGSLPANEQKHVDAMKKMNGKSFDTHYMSMMVNDHKTDIGEFEKASKSAKDADLKNWATKTLPTLKTHLDSAQAINKSKM
jgi:putative membrane protein